MIKKPYIIAALLLTGIAAYSLISNKKEAKPGVAPSPVNMTSLSDLKPIAKPAPGSNGINPPHGQPGHRCDIAAGAPLPGTGKPGVSAQPSFKPVINTPAKSPGPAITKSAIQGNPKLNPPHGEPGHRCDVKTGDPLPEPGSTTTVKPVVPAKQNTDVTPVKISESASALNPAHGKPGHRCDIQVGAPLPAGG